VLAYIYLETHDNDLASETHTHDETATYVMVESQKGSKPKAAKAQLGCRSGKFRIKSEIFGKSGAGERERFTCSERLKLKKECTNW